ncbi:MAG TPA: nucleotidyltransferase domain-containing protein [Burkholderiales bacterium]|nr:nucleotidyltransferase domain-containing protein [Burkholderiales bacterium]
MVRTESGAPAQQVLANLLFGAYRHRVLSLLMLRPGDRFHVRMIARLTGVPAGSLHRELRQLADAGLLLAERSGNQVLYSANEGSPVFHELASMLDKTAGTPPTLHEHAAEYTVEPAGKLPEIDGQALSRICRKYGVKKMSLFGSAARGELRPDSDVDLMVEFKPSSTTTSFDLIDLQDELSALFGNRKVGITSPDILKNPYRRRTIERDLRTLYAARR